MAVATSSVPMSPAEQEAQAIVQGLLHRARAAQRIAETYDQLRVDIYPIVQEEIPDQVARTPSGNYRNRNSSLIVSL